MLMMSQAEALYNLQEIDLQILRHQRRLSEITAALSDNASVNSASQMVEVAEAVLIPLRARQRELELEIQSNTLKAKAAEDRLYSGKVQSPKELQDLQNEGAALRRRNDDLETRLLELMLEIETAEADLAEKEQVLSQISADWESEQAELLAEQAELEKAVEVLNDNRQIALIPVATDSLKVYNSLSKRKANQPIARLIGSSCGTCGIELTQVVIKAARQQDSFVECTNCGRILAVVD
jgi:uncharacterized protein